MSRSSPRASSGLIMLPASMAPSAAPAPTMVCSSSMKVITSPSASVISFSTAFRRSSNSPRYLAPATIEPRSRAMTRLSFSPSGTSPAMMRLARPSTMAVLPTPGSPMSTGLFLVRRERTWMTRRISSSRPMTGSSLPWRASSVRSRPYFSRAWNVSSGVAEVTRWLPRTSRRAASSASRVTPSSSDQAKQQVLDRQVVVAHVGPQAVGRLQPLARRPGEGGLGTPDRPRQPGELLAQRAGDGRRVGPHLLQERARDVLRLGQDGHQQVGRGHLGVVGGRGLLGGGREGLPGLHGPALGVEGHRRHLPLCDRPAAP